MRLEFANENKTTYGINPHNFGSSRYSYRPVIITIHSFLPWICMKKNLMVTLLISGPTQHDWTLMYS